MEVVEAPALEPAVGGILDVVDVQDTQDGHIGYHGVRYQGRSFPPARPVPTDGTDKTFDQRTLIQGEPFSVYHGIDNSMFQHEEAEALAEAALRAGEDYAVEQHIQSAILNARAVDISPATAAVTPKVAIGLLEEYAGQNYAGKPVFHVGRYGASLLPLEWDDDFSATTKQGSPVINGRGYLRSGLTDPPLPGFWMYATGQVHLWRTDVASAIARNPTTNRVQALAERMYVPTVEGFVAAVLITEE